MKVEGQPYRTIWIKPEDPHVVQIIDQRWLPHQFVVEDINSVDEMSQAIRDMHVRGAGLIGAAAGYGMYLATLEAAETSNFAERLASSRAKLLNTRPTAVNLSWALERQSTTILAAMPSDRINAAKTTAQSIADEDVAQCRAIGHVGLPLLEEIAEKKGRVNVLTHCNAGWLAFVDIGTATAPIYAAHDKGLDVHVWVDETRPRNQGARLTAWELAQHGVPHTVIADNVGGHLMQRGEIDIVIVGTDRTTADGFVANKIGTYLKALAASDNDVPFYAAVPHSSFDWQRSAHEIEIEKRGSQEVSHVRGLYEDKILDVRITPEASATVNYGFDITPARLVTGLITERGICSANRASILELYPEYQTE